MAERRMFAKTIIDSDAFLDMPISSQLLYFHLSMRADDDGFINNPKRISRMIGTSDDDLRLLAQKNFIIPFPSGVIVVKHWRVNNYLRNDRYKETIYTEEKALLTIKDNGRYSLTDSMDTNGIPNGYQTDTNGIPRLGKDRLGKDSIDNIGAEAPKKPVKRFVKPSLEEVTAYVNEHGYKVDPERFMDYYEANGWKVGKNAMKDWKATVRNWNKNGYNTSTSTRSKKEGFTDYEGRDIDYTALERKLLGY